MKGNLFERFCTKLKIIKLTGTVTCANKSRIFSHNCRFFGRRPLVCWHNKILCFNIGDRSSFSMDKHIVGSIVVLFRARGMQNLNRQTQFSDLNLFLTCGTRIYMQEKKTKRDQTAASSTRNT